jgi:16S rRNA (uracil1498-N3)-methyltransferase
VNRFYIPPENWNPDSLILTGSETHHARAVLRMKRGDKAVLFNGQGYEITAEIVELTRDDIRLRKLHETETPPLRCRITLGQAIPKGKNMDLIVQKAVEIGAAEIAPIISERTIVELDAKEAEQKQIKWQQVAIEAAKQCGQNWLPRVHTPRKLKDFLSEPFSEPVEATVTGGKFPNALPLRTAAPTAFDLRLIGSLQSDAQHLKTILAHSVKESERRNKSPLPQGEGRVRETFPEKKHRNLPTSVLMMVGPEGDFTPAELALAKSHGCRPITLGPIILRVETAAIYCLSILSYELL